MASPFGLAQKPGWKEKFLEHLKDTQLVVHSADLAGVSTGLIYTARKADPEFARKWDDVLDHATEVLEQIAVRRAAESSDQLMMFLLKARKPQVYRENVHHEHQFGGQIQLTLGTNDSQPIDLPASKRRDAARLLLEDGSQTRDDVIDVVAGAPRYDPTDEELAERLSPWILLDTGD